MAADLTAPPADGRRRSIVLSPRRPYSLAESLLGNAGGTRRRRGGVWEIALRVGDDRRVARVAQGGDGDLRVDLDEAGAEKTLDRLRHVLATDVDHTPFLERFQDDHVIGRAIRARRGMRPARLATVGQSLVAAFAGQLVTSTEARATHGAIVRRLAGPAGYPRRPPTLAEIAALPPAAVAADGLTARRAASLIRVCRRLDVDSLRRLPTIEVAARLQTERDLGPWSTAVVVTSGLGRWELGPVGDLGLMRLCERLNGRTATVEDTRELLAAYGEWQALAGAHLLRLGAPEPRRKPPPRWRM
jgi:3-methyladenine DNA glycosylase/8-oxoguanine DNA glycosylase